MPAADRNDLGPAFQIPALIKDIDQLAFTLGQEQRQQRNDQLPGSQEHQRDAANNNDNAESTDERKGRIKGDGAAGNNDDPKQ